ncbi:DUF2190 family protein [Thalassospira mesophila]|uniref:Recombinase RecA n=1 Tax=Thalassospira mesophila TaxID=1293891 RepID=A0A1Y2L353_9PROT|nr:DUF2190 family protein [Thalassospira mesophila]OSQ39012.1 hypothetical protein TMES_09980 [Thalassospira mesophila]
MKNYIQAGSSLLFVNATGATIASGSPVVVGSQIGVAAVDIADGESGTVQMCDVFSLPKSAGSAIVQGDAVIFDVAASAFVPSSEAPAEGDIVGACTAWEAAESAATSVVVKINTGVGTVTPA